MMYNSDADFLFPSRVIPSLRNLRGELWRDLVDQVHQEKVASLERTAFVLLMARLNGCATCQADSLKALSGCTECSRQAIHRFRGSEQDLIGMYAEACLDVERYLSNTNCFLEGPYV